MAADSSELRVPVPKQQRQHGSRSCGGIAHLLVLAVVAAAAAWVVLPRCGTNNASAEGSGGGYWDVLGDDAVLYERLYNWAGAASGEAPGLRAGRVCRDEGAGRFCMRGAVALRRFEVGDVIVWLPNNATIQLPEANVDAWLRLLYDIPGFNASLAPYLALLPKPGELLLPAAMHEDELSMLQGGPIRPPPPLLLPSAVLLSLRLDVMRLLLAGNIVAVEYTFRAVRRHMEEAHAADVRSPSTVTARHGLTLDQYVLAASTVSTRFWVFADEATGEQRVSMAPLLDMANHADEGAGPDSRGWNAHIQRQGSRTQLVATRPIPAGGEVALSYEAAQLHRPDIALMRYGYWARRRPPLLAAHDLAGAEADALRAGGQGFESPPHDDAFRAGGKHSTQAELARLRSTLAAFATTEAEDRRQLQEDQQLTSRQRALLEFRAERKAALAFVVGRLAAGLAEQ